GVVSITTGGGFGSSGTVVLDGGRLTNNGGNFFVHALTVENGGIASFSAGVGYHISEDFASVQSDGLYDIGSDELDIFNDKSFVLDGGQLTAGSISIFGSGAFQFQSGTCNIIGPGGMGIGAGSPLGNEVHLTPGKSLLVTNTTMLPNGSVMSLEGGL